jgi:membrane protease YdiL (CAAX protease family)
VGVIESGADRVSNFDTHHHAETDPPSSSASGWPAQGEAGAIGSPAEAAPAGRTDPGTPGDVPRQPPSAFIALTQIVLCSGLPTQLVLLFLLSALGVQAPTTTKDWSLSYVAIVLLADSVLVLALILLFLRWSGERPRQIFLGKRSVAWEWSVGIALVPLAFAVIAAINAVVQRYAPTLHQLENPFQPLVRTPYGIVVFTSLSILAGGVREEMQRAFALHRFSQIGIPYTGLLIFSVIFGLGHIVQGWDAAIMTGSLGALWGYVYLRRGSIVAPAVCHGAFDAIQVIAFGLLRR